MNEDLENIRTEVLKLFQDPPSSFIKLIESEVEKRVELRVKQYKLLWGVITGGVIAFLAFFWSSSGSAIKTTVEKELSQNEIIRAKRELFESRDKAAIAIESISNSVRVVSSGEQSFTNRLKMLMEHSDLMFESDLDSVFVSESDPFPPRAEIVLKHEPYSHTVFLNFGAMGYYQGTPYCKVEGKTIKITTPPDWWASMNTSTNKRLISIDYVRRPPIRVDSMR